jgi:hypothetical protein
MMIDQNNDRSAGGADMYRPTPQNTEHLAAGVSQCSAPEGHRRLRRSVTLGAQSQINGRQGSRVFVELGTSASGQSTRRAELARGRVREAGYAVRGQTPVETVD